MKELGRNGEGTDEKFTEERSWITLMSFQMLPRFRKNFLVYLDGNYDSIEQRERR